MPCSKLIILHLVVYQFLIAAVTNYYRLSGLKQHKFIVLEFCTSEFQNTSYRLKRKVPQGNFLSGGSDSILSLFQLLHIVHPLWLGTAGHNHTTLTSAAFATCLYLTLTFLCLSLLSWKITSLAHLCNPGHLPAKGSGTQSHL